MGAREDAKTKKNNVLESVVFSWFADTGLYATPVGGKEGGRNEKNTLCKTWFFRGLPIRAIPLEFLFLLLFVPVQGWCTWKFKTFVFCPCAGLVRFEDLKFKTLIFCLSLYRFGTLWTSKLWFFLSLCKFRALWNSIPNALLHVYCDIIYFHCLQIIVFLFAFFKFPCSFLKSQVHYSCKGFTIWT